jgi:HSP20 family molecular chaperone IbpA
MSSNDVHGYRRIYQNCYKKIKPLKIMLGIDVVVNDLNDLITNIVSTSPKNTRTDRIVSPVFSLINISVNFHAQGLDYPNDNVHPQKIRPQIEQAEPVIDVFEGEKSLKILALLPGVRKDQVSFNVGDGFIDLEIRKGYQVYRKMIPCNVKPSNVSIRSTTFNNSIFEIVFDKANK